MTKKNLRIIARVIIVDGDNILLLQNKGADWWYPAGGGWEYNEETIRDAAVREVFEETGYKVALDKLLWIQEFHENETRVNLELFWLAHISRDNRQTREKLASHINSDKDSNVAKAKWFTKAEVEKLKVFPKRIVDWQFNIKGDDPFIGSFL